MTMCDFKQINIAVLHRVQSGKHEAIWNLSQMHHVLKVKWFVVKGEDAAHDGVANPTTNMMTVSGEQNINTDFNI